jgi:hypothetical protein
MELSMKCRGRRQEVRAMRATHLADAPCYSGTETDGSILMRYPLSRSRRPV